MKKLLAVSVLSGLLMFCLPLLAISQGQFVKVTGKLFHAEDSVPIVANIRYEKLPYRGHTGDFVSSSDGSFEFWLQLDSDYYIELYAEGFLDNYDTIAVLGSPEEVKTFDFYLSQVKEENFVLRDLIFARGSDVIQEISYNELDEFVRWLKARPNLVVQLEGHTDIAGNAEANMRLSQSRVDAVEIYIEKRGIDKNRVRTKAFGGTQPLSEERTPEAIRANRRVEVRVIAR
ncbi:MAG: OmpA family protein [Bacteroidota bacterium]